MIHVCFGDNAGNVGTRPRAVGLPVPASVHVIVNALVGPLLAALSHWLFQPAQIDGQPVSLKILLGIRFSAPR